MKTINVRKVVGSNDKIRYRFHTGPLDWTVSELKGERSFRVNYNKNMTPEDIAKVEEKWGHKIHHELF